MPYINYINPSANPRNQLTRVWFYQIAMKLQKVLAQACESYYWKKVNRGSRRQRRSCRCGKPNSINPIKQCVVNQTWLSIIMWLLLGQWGVSFDNHFQTIKISTKPLNMNHLQDVEVSFLILNYWTIGHFRGFQDFNIKQLHIRVTTDLAIPAPGHITKSKAVCRILV